MIKKKFKFSNDKDISIRNGNFSKYQDYKIRDIVRDYFDRFFRRPVYFFIYKNFFKHQNYKIDLTLPAKGFSTLERRKELNKISKIENKIMLNIGCGNAYDYHLWFKFKPKKIVGVDILNYKNSWMKIKKFVNKEKIKTKVEFYKKDFLNFSYKNKFDFIVCDAVFEHCIDFSKVINLCSKLLKKNGILYSSYGPIWFAYGGDHFSGRDKQYRGFNHLLLNKRDYQNYFKKNVGTLDYELNEGGGGVFVQNDLFSKLNGNEYMDIFKKNKFSQIKTYAEFCPIGYSLIKKNKVLKKRLLKKYPFINQENYYLKTHIVYLKKK